MNIALVGYGKMGREIEQIAIKRGHKISCIIDLNNQEDFDSEAFVSSDVAIEFSNPGAAYANYLRCFNASIPVVSGTTGWLDKIDQIKQACQHGQTFFYASNFSLGVNLFFELNKKLAQMMNPYPEYDVSVKEIHHTQKIDAPSGTAITLAEAILAEIDRKNRWINDKGQHPEDLSIISERTGTVPGYHEIVYESEVDTISISHNAKSRVGLALGAVLAAEFTYGRKGFLTMSDMLGL